MNKTLSITWKIVMAICAVFLCYKLITTDGEMDKATYGVMAVFFLLLAGERIINSKANNKPGNS
jgi:hypothetical protein